jgi:hypothetical protein
MTGNTSEELYKGMKFTDKRGTGATKESILNGFEIELQSFETAMQLT